MSKLDPRPKSSEASKTWEDLNRMLQNTFNNNVTHPALMIDVRDFLMPKHEIIAEAQAQGYKVTEQSEHIIAFE